MSQEYKVMASSMRATYTAGRWIADSPQEACDMARRHYKKLWSDIGSFRFYTVSSFPYERKEKED
jgi:hypothetical protein